MHKSSGGFRYLYGFFILITLLITVFLVKITEDILGRDDARIHATEEEIQRGDIRGKGLPAPTGKFSFGQIIEAYELDKEDFYNALGLPPDYPETAIVKNTIDKKLTNSKLVRDYMQPRIAEFERKIKEARAAENPPENDP
ncbi:MAG: hypothetical protein WDA53_07830 [Bacillota bacterium]